MILIFGIIKVALFESLRPGKREVENADLQPHVIRKSNAKAKLKSEIHIQMVAAQ